MDNFSVIRLRVVATLLILLALLFIAKLFFLQVVNGQRYAERADRQYVTPASGIFERGAIYFQTKERDVVSAATTKSGFKVAIIPRDIEDPEAVYESLAEHLDLDKDDFIARASRTNDAYEEIAFRLDEETARAVRALKLDTVQVFRQKWRSYPGQDLASHMIGFMAYKGNEIAGRYGLERYYDQVLQRTGDGLYVNFFAEVFSNVNAVLSDEEVREGDVYLTVEPSVQTYAEDIIRQIDDRWSSDDTGVIIMNPMDGSIYAMARTPAFDLNNFSQVTDAGVFRNPFVENVFEMGSIMKPLIMASALDTGAVTAETSYFDAGSVKVSDRTIYNFDKKGRGQVTMQDVLNQSLNTGMVHVSRQMKRDDLYDYMYAYGFDEKTGIDLPNETTGLLRNLEGKREVEYANISFGQGIAVTPISVVRALSSLANGGYLVTPHLVNKIEYTSGLVKKVEHPQGAQVIEPATSEEITRMLVGVIDTMQDGAVKLDHYSIAAKTGTAQIPSPTGGYYSDRNLHSFFGYFPAYKPQFIVFFYTIYPKGVRYSSETLLNPFMETVKFLLNYYDVPPDREPPLAVGTRN